MPEPGAIPDPELTLSEAMNVMGVVYERLQAVADPVLGNAWEKLRLSAAWQAEHYPEEFDAIQGEVQMQKRFGMGD